MNMSRLKDANFVSYLADHLVLLVASDFGLQLALNDFAAACDIAKMAIRTYKSEVLHLLRYLSMFSASWLNIVKAGGKRQDKGLDVRYGKCKCNASVALYSIVLKRELLRKPNALCLNSLGTYGKSAITNAIE